MLPLGNLQIYISCLQVQRHSKTYLVCSAERLPILHLKTGQEEPPNQLFQHCDLRASCEEGMLLCQPPAPNIAVDKTQIEGGVRGTNLILNFASLRG